MEYPCSDIFDTEHGAIFIASLPTSGKTTLIGNLLDWLTDGRHKPEIVMFVSTFKSDPSYEAIEKMLHKKNVKIIQYDGIYEATPIENGKMKFTNNLQKEMKRVKEEVEHEAGKKPKTKKMPMEIKKCTEIKYNPTIVSHNNVIEPPFREKIFVFDDLTSSLKDPFIEEMVKKARHHKCRVIVSTQDFLDVPVSFKTSCQHFIAFSGMIKDRIRRFYEMSVIRNMSIEEFIEMYNRNLNKGSYDFMYVSTKGDMRKNFNTKLI